MQKKRCLIYIFAVFLFTVPSAYAIIEEIAIEGWVETTKSLTTDDNKSFSVIISPDGTKISVELPSGSGLMLASGACEIVDYYDICFAGTNVSYHDYEEDRDYYKAKLVIYDVLADIELSRSIANTDLLINEETKVTTEILNSGNRDATDIKLIDRFPSPFIITEISGCKLFGDEVTWEGSLKEQQRGECSYTIKPTANITYTSKANVSYFNGKETKYKYSSSEDLKIPDYQLNIQTNLSTYKLEAEEKVNLSVKILNNHSSYPMQVGNLYIDIPIGLEITNIPALFQRQYNKLKFQGYIEPLDEKESLIELKAKSNQKYTIKIHADYIINNVRKTIERFLVLNAPAIEEPEYENLTVTPPEENLTDIPEETNESIELVNETEETQTVTEDIPQTQPDEEEPEETETIAEENELKESIIKQLYKQIFVKPIFIAIDSILIALIVVVIINIRKKKKKEEEEGEEKKEEGEGRKKKKKKNKFLS